jgi:hypothetical protein
MDKIMDIAKKHEEEMFDSKIIIKEIRRLCDKDSKSYKMTEYYHDLTAGTLDKGGIAIARAKTLNIEKYLVKWIKDNPNNGSTIMRSEENAIGLINDLRKKGLLE